MGNRTHSFTPDGYYHLYNRGVEKRRIFLDTADYERFLDRLAYYQQVDTVGTFSRSGFQLADRQDPLHFDLVCYALMPNHFHLLVRANSEGGIPQSLAQFLHSYTKYFNTRYERVGPLFQGVYQSVEVETDEQLVHLARYILLNSYVAHLEETLGDYRWTSYREHVGQTSGLCDRSLLAKYFDTPDKLTEFLHDYASYARELSYVKDLAID